jgi:hypothetical protein
MPTTTNFGWTTPADTDLVKDGAAAIRTFAGNVDTSLVDLKGGTTGQYLQKNSGTDLDYVWADVSAGGMTLISTTTLTGASVSLTSIPQTYNDLRIVIRNFKPSSDSESLRIEFNGDSTANRHRSDYVYDAGYYDTTATFNAPWGKITTDLDNSVANGITVMDIFDYTKTTTWKMGEYLTYNTDPATTTSFQMRKGAIFYNQTSAISSFDFFPSGGTMTSGTVLLYGVK